MILRIQVMIKLSYYDIQFNLIQITLHQQNNELVLK